MGRTGKPAHMLWRRAASRSDADMGPRMGPCGWDHDGRGKADRPRQAPERRGTAGRGCVRSPRFFFSRARREKRAACKGRAKEAAREEEGSRKKAAALQRRKDDRVSLGSRGFSGWIGVCSGNLEGTSRTGGEPCENLEVVRAIPPLRTTTTPPVYRSESIQRPGCRGMFVVPDGIGLGDS